MTDESKADRTKRLARERKQRSRERRAAMDIRTVRRGGG